MHSTQSEEVHIHLNVPHARHRYLLTEIWIFFLNYLNFKKKKN